MEFDPSSSTSPSDQAERTAAMIHAQFCDEAHPSTRERVPFGLDMIARLRRAADPSGTVSESRQILEDLEWRSEVQIKTVSASQKHVPLHFRRLYADCRLVHSLVDLRDPDMKDADETCWYPSVNRLDMAIVIAGAPGEGRLDLILDTIKLIQNKHLLIKSPYRGVYPQLPTNPDAMASPSPLSGSIAPKPIPCISPPSLSTFRRTLSTSPFILPQFIRDWPALTTHPWRSSAYLREVAGRGRIVPVEVGSDYRAEDWRQEMMSWEKFLTIIGVEADSDGLLNPTEERKSNANDNRGKAEAVYLAQHNLLTQFPALRSDIVVPDYVYASLPAPANLPTYRPPGTDEQLVINAWLGPKGTVSPAHTDPYYNCYAQVVGRKTIWLAPPQFQDEMYPFLNPSAPHTARENPSVTRADDATAGAQIAEPSLANTSRVDVFSLSARETAQFPLFGSHVFPHALCATLEPGDLLYIPPGWWHAMRSEDVSFSVSMWF